MLHFEEIAQVQEMARQGMSFSAINRKTRRARNTIANVEEIVNQRALDLTGGVRMDVGLKNRVARPLRGRFGSAL